VERVGCSMRPPDPIGLIAEISRDDAKSRTWESSEAGITINRPLILLHNPSHRVR
jgi:hypothetical protein